MRKEYSQKKVDAIIEKGSSRERATLFLEDRTALLPQAGLQYALRDGERVPLLTAPEGSHRDRFFKIISWGLAVEGGIVHIYNLEKVLLTTRADLRVRLRQIQSLCEKEDAINLRLVQKTERGVYCSPLKVSPETLLQENTDLPASVRADRRRQLFAEETGMETEMDSEGLCNLQPERTEKTGLKDGVDMELASLRGKINLYTELFFERIEGTKRFIDGGISNPPEIPEYKKILREYVEDLDMYWEVEGCCREWTAQFPALRGLFQREDDGRKDIDLTDKEGAIQAFINTFSM